jgi:hypothetical protein
VHFTRACFLKVKSRKCEWHTFILFIVFLEMWMPYVHFTRACSLKVKSRNARNNY